MRGLEVGQRERLTTTQTDILTHITWRSSGGSSVADLDLCCLLLDNQGRILEVVDFNNPVSNDRAVSHGGDAVSSDDSAKSEQIFIDTRRFAPRVMACALTASQFTGTFGDVKLESADVTLKHLVFVGAATGCSFNNISERQTLVAALSDHAIHLLTEQLSSAGKHRTYKSAGVIVTHSLHRKLVWSPTADRLFSVDS